MSMDRRIEKDRRPFYIKLGASSILALGLAYFGYGALTDSAIATFRVDREWGCRAPLQ